MAPSGAGVLPEAQPVATNAQPTSFTDDLLPDPSPQPPPKPRPGGVAYQAAPSSAADEPIVSIGRPVSREDYGAEGNRKAARLLSMPPERFTFDRALLRDVLRFLGEACGIPYVGVPENSPQAMQLVTFTMEASPFAALQSVAQQYQIGIKYEKGVWFMELPDTISERHMRLKRVQESQEKNKLVAVLYQLRYDSPDRVDFRAELMRERTGTTTDELATTPGTANLPLQTSQKVFAHKIPRLVNDIRAMLGIPLLRVNERTGEIGEAAGDENAAGAIIDLDRKAAMARAELEGKELSQLIMTPGGAVQQTGDAALQKDTSARPTGGLEQPDTLTPLYVPPERPQVIYNSDQNTLWVVATRQQQEWVAQYLKNVDKQQELIAIEVKFLETKKNPQTDIGINWQNTFGTGLTVTGGASIGGQNIGNFGFTNGFNNQRTDNQQIGSGQSSNSILTNSLGQSSTFTIPGSPAFSNSIIENVTTSAQTASASVPYSAVLSLDQFSVTLQAFMQDRDTSLVQYPRVLTLNNREVAITSSENTPLNIGTSDVGGGQGGATQTVGQLGYLPTGTQINVLPKVVDGNKIAMTVAITVSSIVGELPINLGTGVNLYPITSGRVFNASLQVDSGYTLAVGGLEKVDDSNFEGGIPVLKDIPGLGYLFKNKNKKRNKVNLIIFITPYLIGDPGKTPGISETPKSIVPMRPGVPPEAPTFTPDGRLSGGDAAVAGAFAWLEFQLNYFRQVNIEAMMTVDSISKLRDVIGVARAVLSYLQTEAGLPPYDPETSSGRNALRAEEMLTDLNVALAYAQDNLM